MYTFITLTLIAAATAEAPYFSSRPSVNAPSFNYSPPGVQTVSQPQPIPAPAPQYAASIAPLPISQPSPQQYVQYPPTVNAPRPQSQPNYEGYNYERPSIAPVYIQQQPQPAPQPAPQPIQFFNNPSQPQPQQGYSYPSQQGYSISSEQALPVQNSFQPQPQIQYAQPQQQLQYAQPQFLQTQQVQTQAIAQPAFGQQSAVLDNQVVSQVQNILAQNEDSYARNLGYLHRISGVSLEGASPSVELSAFVHNVPIASARVAAAQSQSQQAVSSSSASQSSLSSLASGSAAAAAHSGAAGSARSLSSSYGLPTVVDNRSAKSASSSDSSNYNFIPSQSQPSSGYGFPN